MHWAVIVALVIGIPIVLFVPVLVWIAVASGLSAFFPDYMGFRWAEIQILPPRPLTSFRALRNFIASRRQGLSPITLEFYQDRLIRAKSKVYEATAN